MTEIKLERQNLRFKGSEIRVNQKEWEFMSSLKSKRKRIKFKVRLL